MLRLIEKPYFVYTPVDTMTATLPSIAVPGARLGDSSVYISGPGTHVHNSSIYASIAGPVILRDSSEIPSKQQQQQRGILTVGRSPVEQLTAQQSPQPPTSTTTNSNNNSASKQKLKYNTLPSVNSIILGRVTRVQKRQATLSILVVLDPDTNPTDLTSPALNALIASSAIDPASTPVNTADDTRFQALIRKEDVRAVEKDRVVMDEMFRVGDIVRAVVISIGDQAFFYASTARNELGVVIARGEDGGGMLVPVSWKEMRDLGSGVGELRKVAKPF